MKADDDMSHHNLPLNAAASKPETSPIRRPRWQKLLPAIALVGLGAGSGIVVTRNYLLTGDSLRSQTSSPQPIMASPASAISASQPTAAGSNFITQVIGKVGPAVVRIDSTKAVTDSLPGIANDPFFHEFFGNQIPTPPTKQIVRGSALASSSTRMARS